MYKSVDVYYFHDVFICKSEPWTPSELDKKFWELVRGFSQKLDTAPSFIGHRWPELEHTWRKKYGRKEIGIL